MGEITLVTLGDQMLTVTDTVDDTLAGSATITVGPSGSAPAPGGSPRPFGPGTIRVSTLAQNAKASSADAGVERFFAAVGDEESTFRWLRWELRNSDDRAGWVLDLWCQEESRFI
jgi:hypothetical protein